MKKLLPFLVLIEVVLIYFLFYGTHKIFDDNLTQWLPILKQAVEYINEGGIMAYDIYQFGGYPVMAYGYYGTQNILLLFIGVILDKLSIDLAYTFVVYEIFGYLIAAYAIYRLFAPKKNSMIFLYLNLIALFMLNMTFIGPHVWYYIVNNIIQISLLIIVLLSLINSFNSIKNYFYLAIVISFCAYLGNIQYFFYFVVFILLLFSYLLVLFYLRRRNKFKRLLIYCFTNFILALFLLSPFIILSLSLKASTTPFKPIMSSRATIDSAYFYLEWLFPIIQYKEYFDLTVPYFHKHIFQAISWSVVFSFIALFRIKYFFSSKYPLKYRLLMPPFLIMIIFLIYLLTHPVSSDIFGFKEFRYSYKYIFFIYPLLLVPLSFLAYSLRLKKLNAIAISTFLVINILTIIFAVNSGLKIPKTIAKHKSLSYNIIDEYNLDVKNYRVLVNYEIEDENLSRKPRYFDKYLTANAATAYKTHTIVGYEPSLSMNISKSLGINEDGLLMGYQYILSEENIDVINRYNIKYIIAETDNMTYLFDKLNLDYSLVHTKNNMYLYNLKNITPILSTFSNNTKMNFNGSSLNITNLPPGKSTISYNCSESSLYLKWYSNNNNVQLLCNNGLLEVNNGLNKPVDIILSFSWIYLLYFMVSVLLFFLLFIIFLLRSKTYILNLFNIKKR